MSDVLDLFAPPATPEVREIHERLEAAHAAFLGRVRGVLAGMYGGSGIAISTDDAWRCMEGYGIKLPADASPNLMGSLFSAWSRAKPIGWTRSKREGSHGNLLRLWEIE